MAATESIQQIHAELHAQRVATMPPDELQVNIDQRAELERRADRARFVKPGDRVAPFSLPDVTGGAFSLTDALAKSPAVILIFFRFASCPACNLALPFYQRNLLPELQSLGIPLIAVSPQVPERLIDIRTRHALDFTVASDIDNGLARRFGIAFTANAASQDLARRKGFDLPEVVGSGTWELPFPSVIVIDRDAIVRFADIAPDWLKRTEVDPILVVARTLALQNAA